MALSFNLCQKQGTGPHLYVMPNTLGKAFISLTKGTSGEPRVATTDTAEYFQITKELSLSGLWEVPTEKLRGFFSFRSDLKYLFLTFPLRVFPSAVNSITVP